jgi:hypothetical protein
MIDQHHIRNAMMQGGDIRSIIELVLQGIMVSMLFSLVNDLKEPFINSIRNWWNSRKRTKLHTSILTIRDEKDKYLSFKICTILANYLSFRHPDTEWANSRFIMKNDAGIHISVIPEGVVKLENVTIEFVYELETTGEEDENKNKITKTKSELIPSVFIEAENHAVIQKFLKCVTDWNNKYTVEQQDLETSERQKSSKVEFYTLNGREKTRLTYTAVKCVMTQTFNSVFFQQKDELLNLLDDYTHRTGRYSPKFEYPHRCVIWMTGPPGNGKTTSIKTICAKFPQADVQIINNWDSILTDADLHSVFFGQNSQTENDWFDFNSMRIILLEDIDAKIGDIIKTRKNENDKKRCDISPSKETETLVKMVSSMHKSMTNPNVETFMESKVTLSGLLNVFDGVIPLENVIIICTTNHMENIDPALYRPGRCDIMLNYANLNLKNFNFILQFYFPDETVSDGSEIATLLETGKICSALWKTIVSSSVSAESAKKKFILDANVAINKL